MLLYNAPVSGNCYKVRLLFAQLGIECERREVDVFDRSDRPELLGGLNPALRVPTLVFDDGRTLAESNAILFYFGDGTEYVPQDRYERAQVLQWMFFEQYSHEPYIAVARFWMAFAPKEELEKRRHLIPEWHAKGNAALGVMESHLARRDWFAGGRYSIADIALYGYTHRAADGGFDLAAYPAVRAWLKRVASEPGHVPLQVAW